MSIYEHLCRILNFDRAWYEGCKTQSICARSISINEYGLPFSAERTELIVTALRRLVERLPELVEVVHSPLPLPEDPSTVLWVIKCPHWGAAPARFKDGGINFAELCLADESMVWLTRIRELNKELKQLYQAQTLEEKKSEGLFFWKQYASSLIQTDIAAKKKIRSTLSESKPLEMQWLAYPIDCY